MSRRRHDTLYLPAFVRQISQPLFARLLMGLAGYKAKLEGNIPDQAAFAASYPHRQHADSLVLRLFINRLSVMGGADHWFHTDPVRQLGVSAVINTIPLLRAGKEDGPVGRSERSHELDMIAAALSRGDIVNWYVTGSRVGPADLQAEFYTPGIAPGLKGMKPGIAKYAQELQVPVVPLGFIYPTDYQPNRLNDVPDAWQNFKNRLRGEGRPVDIVIRAGVPIPPPPERGSVAENKKARAAFLGQLATALWELAHSEEAQAIADSLSIQPPTR